MKKPSHQVEPDSMESSAQAIDQLKQDLAQAKATALRCQADYQNLIRRTQEDRIRLVKLATRGLVESLLQPLDHLSLASAELKDQGLDMVVNQLWKALSEEGLEEIKVMGQPFDPLTMEVVDKKGEGEVVQAVVRKGYRLHGEVIQHAKVIVG
jgi:molecular chaperone GrpE